MSGGIQVTQGQRARGTPAVTAAALLGVLSLGAAILSRILLLDSHLAGLAIISASLITSSTLIALYSTPEWRRSHRRLVAIGAGAGILATLFYDASRWILARAATEDFDPFAALPFFGDFIVGSDASDQWRWIAGAGVHALNGTLFGVLFLLVFSTVTYRRGIAYGLTLEVVQLALYPDWLNISNFTEFAAISSLGHFVYGSSLVFFTKRLARYLSSRQPEVQIA